MLKVRSRTEARAARHIEWQTELTDTVDFLIVVAKQCRCKGLFICMDGRQFDHPSPLRVITSDQQFTPTNHVMPSCHNITSHQIAS